MQYDFFDTKLVIDSSSFAWTILAMLDCLDFGYVRDMYSRIVTSHLSTKRGRKIYIKPLADLNKSVIDSTIHSFEKMVHRVI